MSPSLGASSASATPRSVSGTPRNGDALERATAQVEQYQAAVNAAIEADDMEKAKSMDGMLDKATRRLHDMELAQFNSPPRSRSVSNASHADDSSVFSHTWWEQGSLGISIIANAPSHEAPEGVKLSRVDHHALPAWLVEGLELREVEGTDVTALSYTATRDMLKTSVRPLTVRFSTRVNEENEARPAMVMSSTSGVVSSSPRVGGAVSPLDKGSVLKQLETTRRQGITAPHREPGRGNRSAAQDSALTSDNDLETDLLRDLTQRGCSRGCSQFTSRWWPPG